MSTKPDLKRIEADLASGVIISRLTWAQVLGYAIDLENRLQITNVVHVPSVSQMENESERLKTD